MVILAILMIGLPIAFLEGLRDKSSNSDVVKIEEETSTVEYTTTGVTTVNTTTKHTTKGTTKTTSNTSNTTKSTSTINTTTTPSDVTTFGTTTFVSEAPNTTIPTETIGETVTQASTEETKIVETVTELTDETIITTEEIKETEEAVKEYVVYKPSTHYIHRNTCHWFDDTCIEIEDTNGLECRRCSECHPDMEIITEYVEPAPAANSGQSQLGSDGQYHSALAYVTEEERIMLCNLVALEGGSNWISTYDKACIVCTVMNRYHDGGWSGGCANTIYNVITAPYQYAGGAGVSYYISNVNQGCIDAVDYYFEHQSDFPHYTGFWGDGSQNHFR